MPELAPVMTTVLGVTEVGTTYHPSSKESAGNAAAIDVLIAAPVPYKLSDVWSCTVCNCWNGVCKRGRPCTGMTRSERVFADWVEGRSVGSTSTSKPHTWAWWALRCALGASRKAKQQPAQTATGSHHFRASVVAPTSKNAPTAANLSEALGVGLALAGHPIGMLSPWLGLTCTLPWFGVSSHWRLLRISPSPMPSSSCDGSDLGSAGQPRSELGESQSAGGVPGGRAWLAQSASRQGLVCGQRSGPAKPRRHVLWQF